MFGGSLGALKALIGFASGAPGRLHESGLAVSAPETLNPKP